MNLTSGASVERLLSLDNIRGQLIRLEDTIIFLLIERGQFAYNKRIYETGAFKSQIGWEGSWLEWFLFEIESFHAKARRYTSPDEYPFTPIDKLPKPIIDVQDYPVLLHPQSASHPSVNANSRILDFYVNHIVPGITEVTPGSPRRGPSAIAEGTVPALDDGNYGSAATRDVEVLQALSRRIHFGMFVSESKFQEAPWDFIPHILSNPPNTAALEALITKPEVEARLLVRLANKARVYGCEMDADGRVVTAAHSQQTGGKIDIEQVVRLYRDWVIPLTKDVELMGAVTLDVADIHPQVDYLVHRLDGVSQEQIDTWLAAGKKN
ncbi:chorismate mutase aro7 [Apiotrichum porosum]|uniref:Chorismate mutase n=1 Tax=Apiotrichum porosum TaxID=105984 RepID=A0A427XQG8_9TREE|nr:chorismate mutase aro7 [Apiotrichum porosum]RSH81106.1 chorismate mutase aro7 [Apiotrichum porosum]